MKTDKKNKKNKSQVYFPVNYSLCSREVCGYNAKWIISDHISTVMELFPTHP